MKRYAFLVRGINVGGRHKVVMEEFCRELEELGMSHVSSYINSGNLFFDSTLMKEELLLVLEEFLNKAYPFIKVFSLFTLEDIKMKWPHYLSGGRMISIEKTSSYSLKDLIRTK